MYRSISTGRNLLMKKRTVILKSTGTFPPVTNTQFANELGLKLLCVVLSSADCSRCPQLSGSIDRQIKCTLGREDACSQSQCSARKHMEQECFWGSTKLPLSCFLSCPSCLMLNKSVGLHLWWNWSVICQSFQLFPPGWISLIFFVLKRGFFRYFVSFIVKACWIKVLTIGDVMRTDIY